MRESSLLTSRRNVYRHFHHAVHEGWGSDVSSQEKPAQDVAIDISHITVMSSEEFQQFVEQVSPALRVVLESHRARRLGGQFGGSFNSYIEPGL